MRRREFLGVLGGAAAAWPLAARAQQVERVRRVGVLMSSTADDREAPARIATFLGGLQQLGWIEGRNMRIDIRSAAGDLDLNSKKYAAELVGMAPDVLLATAGPTVAALQGETRTVPIVFAHAVDPVGAGFVASLARPNSNATGFILFEFSIGAKWLELLKEFAPNVVLVRAAVSAALTGCESAMARYSPRRSPMATSAVLMAAPTSLATVPRNASRRVWSMVADMGSLLWGGTERAHGAAARPAVHEDSMRTGRAARPCDVPRRGHSLKAIRLLPSSEANSVPIGGTGAGKECRFSRSVRTTIP